MEENNNGANNGILSIFQYLTGRRYAAIGVFFLFIATFTAGFCAGCKAGRYFAEVEFNKKQCTRDGSGISNVPEVDKVSGQLSREREQNVERFNEARQNIDNLLDDMLLYFDNRNNDSSNKESE